MSSSLSIENEINVNSVQHLTENSLTKHPKETITPQPGTGFGWIHAAFGLAVILIASASIYDAFLVYEYRAGIVEQNPICDWLIRQEPKSVSLFLVAKGAGTAGVVSVLLGLFFFWRRAGIAAAISLVFFQAGLMVYLHTSDGSRRNISLQLAGTHNHFDSEIQPIDTNEQSTQVQKRTRSKADASVDSKTRQRSFRRGRFRSHAGRMQNRNLKKTQRKRPTHQNTNLLETS